MATKETKEKSISQEIEEIDKKIEEIKNPKKENDPFEKVLLEIPISLENEEDWVCIINGHSYQIQRGEKVLVPRCVKELYDNEQKQLKEANRRSRELQNAAVAKRDRLAFD